jgi:hypothetical protein
MWVPETSPQCKLLPFPRLAQVWKDTECDSRKHNPNHSLTQVLSPPDPVKAITKIWSSSRWQS